MNIPDNLQIYFNEGTENIDIDKINALINNTNQYIESPEKFLSVNKEILEYYISFMQSEEYKNTQMYQLNSLLKEFNKANGYYDIFIPSMRIISKSYDEYSKKAEIAKEKFITQYP